MKNGIHISQYNQLIPTGAKQAKEKKKKKKEQKGNEAKNIARCWQQKSLLPTDVPLNGFTRRASLQKREERAWKATGCESK